MSEEKALALTNEWTDDRKALAKRTVCRGASNDEFDLFMAVCQRTGLDPFARQIYSIRRKQWNTETRSYDENQITQVSIDGFRLIADRTNKYAGQVGPWWCGKDGNWREVWLEDEPPAAAKVGVLRHDFHQPIYSIAIYKAYVQTNKNDEPVSRWKTDPAGMIAKCAESLALRRAFPQELSGLYTTEEMGQADNSVTVEWKPTEQPTTTTPTNTNELTRAPFANVITMPDETPADEETLQAEAVADVKALTYTGPLAKVGNSKYPVQWARLCAAYTRANQYEVDGILKKLALPQETKPEDVITAINKYLDAKANA